MEFGRGWIRRQPLMVTRGAPQTTYRARALLNKRYFVKRGEGPVGRGSDAFVEQGYEVATTKLALAPQL